MSLLAHGNSISEVEITNISAHGAWLLAHGEELFMSYDDFPWFKEMSVQSIVNVEEESPNHFYWPDLDVDSTREIIEHPDRFPLKSKST
ncbi:MAG: integron cassette protein [Verrucomicrobiae bacterium]|nr:integron cassette protein [Verrucomicrobiae bacterium]